MCQMETGFHYKSPVKQTTWEVVRKTRPLLCLSGGIWPGQTGQRPIEAEVRHKCTNTHCQSQIQ